MTQRAEQRFRRLAAMAEEHRRRGDYAAAEKSWARLASFIGRLPTGAPLRTHQAGVLGNRAMVLRSMGRHDEAEDAYGQAQTLFDALRSDEYQAAQLVVRVNRANNLASMGHHEAAEALYLDADRIADTSIDDESKRADHAFVRTNRASNLQSMGRHGDAESLFAQAQALVEGLPMTPATRWSRCNLLMNRGNNYQAMGRMDAAESVYDQAQAGMDALDDSEATRSSRASIRVNRARNLAAIGNHASAEALYADAQRLFDHLSDRDAAGVNRASVQMNRGINLQRLGRAADAEVLFVAAQALFDELGAYEAAHILRARVRINRALNLADTKRAGEAETLYAEAQRLYEQLPDSDSEAVSADLAGLHLNRAWALLDLGRLAHAAVHWDRGFNLFDAGGALRLHESVRTAGLLPRYAMGMVALQRAGAVDGGECASRLLTLCRWSLDWLDTMPDAGQDSVFGVVPGASEASLTIGIVLSWLAEARRADLIPGLLADYHGRYAAGQQSTARSIDAAASGSGAMSAGDIESIATLRFELRSLAWRIRAMESRDAVARDAAFESQLAGLRRQRAAVRERLLQGRRQLQASRAGDRGDISVERLRRALRQGVDSRALVILLRVSTPRPDDRETAEPHPLALIVVAHSPTVRVVSLFGTKLGPTLEGARPARHQGRASRGYRTETADVPDAKRLRSAVMFGWNAIVAELGGANDVHVALHHELGSLPWQTAEDDSDAPRLLTVHHGISLALQALEDHGGAARVSPPDATRPLGVLANSPETPDERLPAIPRVYADVAITAALVTHHQILDGRDDLLHATQRLLQLSCHGSARWVQTGRADALTSAYDVAMALDERQQRLEACILVACSTGEAGGNPWGEFDGWSAVLGRRVKVIVGALYPVDDLFCSLFVLLLHRAWRRTGDLKDALRDVRRRLRSGRWADSEEECARVGQVWLEAVLGTVGPAEDIRAHSRMRDGA